MRRASAFAFICFVVAGAFAEPSYLVGLVAEALGRSTQAVEARLDLDAARLDLAKEENRWWPRLSIDSPSLASFTRTGAENVVVLNAYPLEGDKNIYAFDAAAGIEQRLPGSGAIRLSASQETEFASDYAAWRQSPSFQLSISQPLGPGAFGVGPDPEGEKSRAGLGKARLAWMRSGNDIVTKALSVMATMDEADIAWQVAATERDAVAILRDVARRKAEQGAITRADLWKAEADEARAARQADKADFDRAMAADDWSVLFGSTPRAIIDADRDALLAACAGAQGGEDSVELRALEDEARVAVAERRLARVGRAPLLSLSLSLTPDVNAHYFSQAWTDSWTGLTGSTAPLVVSGALGLKYAIPSIGDRGDEEATRDLAVRRIAAEIAGAKEAESAELFRSQREISRLASYKATLDGELERDVQEARDRDALLAQGGLSPETVMDSRVDSLRLRAERIGIEWRLIALEARCTILAGADLRNALASPRE
ncbi:MAG: hypothetical protein M0001_02090 [Treponema sp.]|nr:hypothetical protein [Treponema sp.]